MSTPEPSEDKSPRQQPAGLPLRALAMVLISLSILFAGIGAFSLTRSSADETAAPDVETTTTTTPPAPATTTTTTPAAPDKSVPVRVFNNTQIQGLAARTAAKLTENGWTIAETGNFQDPPVPKTTVYYGNSPNEKSAAAAIAALLGCNSEQRIPPLADRPPGVIVVVTSE